MHVILLIFICMCVGHVWRCRAEFSLTLKWFFVCTANYNPKHWAWCERRPLKNECDPEKSYKWPPRGRCRCCIITGFGWTDLRKLAAHPPAPAPTPTKSVLSEQMKIHRPVYFFFRHHNVFPYFISSRRFTISFRSEWRQRSTSHCSKLVA